jgi:hypothetical protein
MPVLPSSVLVASITASRFTAPLNKSGTATPNGLATVPLPVKVGVAKMDEPPLAWIVPITVNLDVGESVPIPTFPSLSSKIVESPMTDVFVPNPAHFVILPPVPEPATGTPGLAAGFIDDTSGISLHGNARRPVGNNP